MCDSLTEKKKTELCQELGVQARDLRFQHSTSLTARNNCIIVRMEVSCSAPTCFYYHLEKRQEGGAGLRSGHVSPWVTVLDVPSLQWTGPPWASW